MPPPERSIGAESSIASLTSSLPLNVAVKASMGPSPGVVSQTISHGRAPRIMKTAKDKALKP